MQTARIEPGCRVLQLASISFDAAGSDLFLALCSGATLCIPLTEQAQDPVELQHFMKVARISFASMTPTILGALNEKQLPDLTTVVVGGEVCPAPIAQAWIKRGALYNEYGPTEATVCTTLLHCTSDRLPPNIGYPIRNVQVYLLDAQMHPVPIGESGEIYIGGVGIARGYLHQPELNAERFIPNPFAKDGDSLLYRSGDIGRQLPDGSLLFLGRQDNQIKLRGLRIELGEIEAALLTHPAIKSCVVQVHEVRPGDKRLAAYARHAFHCSEALTDNLRALASQEGVTLYVTLMAAFLALLGRATGQRDVAVETALSHQERPELRGIIGVFVSQVLIRVDLSKSANFRDILQHVRSQVLGAVSNPDVPLVKLQQLYSTDPKAEPFFNVSFLLDPPSPPLPAGWSLDRMSLYNDFATCDLLLQFCERGRELYGCFEYSTDLFDAAAMSGLSKDFESLLTQVTEDPTLPV